MKKFIITLLAFAILSIQSFPVQAGRGGGAAAGVAAGLIGGAMIAGAASSSGRRAARRAEGEAREAQYQTEQLRQEQNEKMRELQHRLTYQQMMQRSGTTFNILILAIAILFLCVVGLAIIVLRRR